MSCPLACCTWCYEHCFAKPTSQKKYAGIKYKSPQEANVSVKMPDAHYVPTAKVFEFPQHQSEFLLHPQVSQARQLETVTIQPFGVQPLSQRHTTEIFEHGSPRRTRSSTSPTLFQDTSQQTIGIRPRSATLHLSHPLMKPPPSPLWRHERSASLTATNSDSIPLSVQPSGSRPPLQRSKTIDSPHSVDMGSRPRLGMSSLTRSETVESFTGLPAWSDATRSKDESDYGELEPSLLPCSQAHQDDDETLPSLYFSLYYDMQRNTLTVMLNGARNLLPGSSVGPFNPFVVLHLDPNKVEIYESKVISDTFNPTYEQSFDFQKLMPDEVRRQKLVFRVYNHGKVKELVGGVLVPLGEVDLYGIPMRAEVDLETKEFKKSSKGDLLLSLQYIPQRDEIKGVVLKATSLQKQDLLGSADPYVKIYLTYQGRRFSKWKTSVRRNTLLPIFNENFQFKVSSMDLSDIILEVKVMDYDRFSRNDLMGVVLIGENVEHESGKAHWAEMIGSVNQAVSHWHSLLPRASLKRQPRS